MFGAALRTGGPMGRGGVGEGLSLIARMGAVSGCCLLLAQCGQAPSGKLDSKYGVPASPRLVALGEPVPKGGGTYRIGKPYTVGGRVYEPQVNPNYSAEGLASWYGEDFHGRQTANGEVYDMASISAAHPTLPIPSYARVTNLSNQRSIIVRVNDRGPYHATRVIDVSVRTAKLLGFYDNGVTRVRVDYVGRAALEGSDDIKLAATLRNGTPAPGPAEIRLASSRAFMPQSAEAGRGNVPVPARRPFELGKEEPPARSARRPQAGEVAAATRRPLPPAHAALLTAIASPPQSTPDAPAKSASRSASSDERERGFAARFAPADNLPAAPAPAGPASAFAAPSNSAIVSGRGLY